MSSYSIQSVTHWINSQLENNQNDRFVIDERIAKIAQNQFNTNYSRRLTLRRAADYVQRISVVNLIASLYAITINPIVGLCFAVANIAQFWFCAKIITRVRGRSLIASGPCNGNTMIKQISKGKDIYVRYSAFTLSELNDLKLFFHLKLKAKTCTEIQSKAMDGLTNVVAYLMLLESNPEKRAQLATEALGFARDKKSAQDVRMKKEPKVV